jgi:hypothetical protein
LSIKENNGKSSIKLVREIQMEFIHFQEFDEDNIIYNIFKDIFIRLKEFLNEVIKTFQNKYINKNNSEIILKINQNNENININEICYKEENILDKQTQIKQNNNNPKNPQDDDTKSFISYKNNSYQNSNNNHDFKRCPNKNNILEYVKIIYHYQNKEVMKIEIKELSNGWFTSAGEGGNLELQLYDEKYNLIEKDISFSKTKTELTDKFDVYNFKEVLIEEHKSIKLLFFTKNKAYYSEINPKNIEQDKLKVVLENFEIPTKKLVNCLEIKNGNFIMLSTDDVVLYKDKNVNSKNREQTLKNIRSNPIRNEEIQLINKHFSNIIEIEDNIIFLTSNKECNEKRKKAIFYNINTQTIIEEIKDEYSFNTNQNSLYVIKNDKDKKINILCPCKNYGIKPEASGILLIEYSNDKIIKNKEFVDTNGFEVTSFCSLEKTWFKEQLIKRENSEFFLVGGNDSNNNNVGIIKLYRIIYKDNKAQITELQDLKLPDLKGIDSIIQSGNNGNILVTCKDGKIHLFTAPNIDNYTE